MLHKNKYITKYINYIKIGTLITLKEINRLHQNKIHKLMLLRQKKAIGRLNAYCLLYSYGIRGIPFKWFNPLVPNGSPFDE